MGIWKSIICAGRIIWEFTNAKLRIDSVLTRPRRSFTRLWWVALIDHKIWEMKKNVHEFQESDFWMTKLNSWILTFCYCSFFFTAGELILTSRCMNSSKHWERWTVSFVHSSSVNRRWSVTTHRGSCQFIIVYIYQFRHNSCVFISPLAFPIWSSFSRSDSHYYPYASMFMSMPAHEYFVSSSSCFNVLTNIHAYITSIQWVFIPPFQQDMVTVLS